MEEMKKIYYAKPSITALEIEYVNDAIKNGWGEHCYDYIYRFQNLFKQYLNVKYALATSSCTGALHLALAALDIKTGDEVILPDITWIASVSPVTYLSAKPVFVDVLPDSWCINPEKVEKAITPKTKAIIAVHLYGNLVEMDAILKIAKKYNLYVIEDAAEALGSEYKEKKAGSMANFGVFSFHGTKTITTGEGGMLVTNNQQLFEKVSILADHGRNPKVPKQFWCEQIGYKYKISNLQAALGCAQMKRIEELINKKREIFTLYQEYFRDIKGIVLNPEPVYTKNSYWMPTIIFDKSLNINRDNLINKFKENNVDARVFFYPISSFPMFVPQKENVVSYDIYYRGLNLPSYFELDKESVKRVVDIIKEEVIKTNSL